MHGRRVSQRNLRGKLFLGLEVFDELHAKEQPLTANVTDDAMFTQTFESLAQPLAHLASIGQQVTLDDFADGGDPRRGSDGVPFKCMAFDESRVFRSVAPERLGDMIATDQR